ILEGALERLVVDGDVELHALAELVEALAVHLDVRVDGGALENLEGLHVALEVAELMKQVRLPPAQASMDLECVLLEVQPLLGYIAGILNVPPNLVGVHLEVELEGILPLELALDTVSSLLCKAGGVRADAHLY